ncbi:hypothetical protein A3780_20340 [Kosakonia radicincitans]|uniref:response regulator transcription factor n=1 Tax=Kosakonia radicincitans TaxID=283686 RepID=UPI00090399D7|nr:response regulator transcription factor [Kosakonia radicincitans]APG19795.1 hypothetical protein A3780_20340 [Kosakonia radicincitans]
MFRPDRYFDRVVVMDRCFLSGQALCELAGEACGCGPGQYVNTLQALHGVLEAGAGHRMLIITELLSDREPLSAGLALLDALQTPLGRGHCRVMVCTDLTDPLLLKVMLNRRPSVITLRRESLSVLRQAVRMTGESWPGTVLSPAVTEGLALVRDLKLAPRELEWLVTQMDGMGLKASARAMNVSYKTVATWRRNISLQVGYPETGAFTWRLAQMQHDAGISPQPSVLPGERHDPL